MLKGTGQSGFRLINGVSQTTQSQVYLVATKSESVMQLPVLEVATFELHFDGRAWPMACVQAGLIL